MKKIVTSVGAITIGISLGLGIVKMISKACTIDHKEENDSLIYQYRNKKKSLIDLNNLIFFY